MALKTTNRVSRPKDYSLGYSLNEVYNNTGVAEDITDINNASNIHTENFQTLYDERVYLNSGGIHFAEINVPARFLIKSFRVQPVYNGDFAAEFLTGSDIVTLNGENIHDLESIDGVWVYINELAESITKEENILRVQAEASIGTADSTMRIELKGFQL